MTLLSEQQVPFDMLLCKQEKSLENTAQMKHDAVLGLTKQLGFRHAIFMDDSVCNSEAMLAGGMLNSCLAPILMRDGSWQPCKGH